MTSSSAFKSRGVLGNRRSHGRAKLSVPVLLDTARSYFKLHSKDVSESGLGLESSGDLEVGRSVDVYFELPTGASLEVCADVVRTEEESIGLCFRQLSDEDARALKLYCEQWKAALIQRCSTRQTRDRDAQSPTSAAPERVISARPLRSAAALQPSFYDDSETSSEIRIRYR